MRSAAVFLLWGAMLAGILAVGLIFFGFPDPETPVLFGGSIATMVILAALLTRRGWGDLDGAFLRSHPDVSLPVPWLGVWLALLAVSLEVGLWLTLISAGMLVAGVAGLLRELGAERAALREARRDGGGA